MKLLERLFKEKIKSMIKVNVVQSQKFGDMLEASLDTYNQCCVTTKLVIRKLVEFAKTMQTEGADRQDLGLSV